MNSLKDRENKKQKTQTLPYSYDHTNLM